MGAPVVLRWPVPDDLVARFEVACPQCGATRRLLLGMDLEDRSDAPSVMGCPDGHTWLEERVPRSFGASLLAEILDADPVIVGRLEELQGMYGQE